MDIKFAQRIKDLRVERQLTQRQLCQMLDTYQSTIAKWELGELEPGLSMLAKIAIVLEVSTDYLLGLKDF